MPGGADHVVPYIFAAFIGIFVAMSELIGRYRDAPFSAIRNSFTLVYAFINAMASIVTLYMILDAGLFAWPTTGIASSLPAKVLISGIGAMTLLRAGISIQISGETKNFSFANLLNPILHAADNEVNRSRASNRIRFTQGLMLGLDVETAIAELPMLCLTQMQGIPEDEQKRLADDVKALSAQKVSKKAKLITLGSILLNAVGEVVLTSAVEFLKESQEQPVQEEDYPAVPIAVDAKAEA